MTAKPKRADKAIIAIAMSLVAGSCTFNLDGLDKPLACAASGSASGLGEVLALSVGVPRLQPLRDDSGEVLHAVEARCMTDACEPRIAQVGTQIELHIDATALASRRHVALGNARPELISTDPEVIKVAQGDTVVDPCLDNLEVHTSVKFEKEGHAALRMRQGAVDLASFSFDVAQATRLEVTAQPGAAPEALQIDGGSVRGGLQTTVLLLVQAYAADGREMLLDNSVLSTIEDTAVAKFVLSKDPNATLGVKLHVVFQQEGSTVVRTTSGELTTVVELHADPSLPSPQPPAAASTSP